MTTATGATATPVSGARVVLGKASYDRRMRELGTELATSVESMYPLVQGAVGSATARESISHVEKAQAAVARVTSAVSDILPPAPIRADHRRLVAELGVLQGELGVLVGVLQHGGSKPFGSYMAFPALSGIALVTGDMKKKGFAVG